MTSLSTVLIERVRHLNQEEKPLVFAEVEKTIEKIQPRAFNLFGQRGGLPGLDWYDWLLAEHDVLGTSSAELLESDKGFKLRIAAPGVEPKEVTVTATSEPLIVQANARHRHSGAGGEVRFCEFSDDKLCRQFGLPSRIAVKAISESLDKGILHSVAAKASRSSAKETAVASAGAHARAFAKSHA
jgi:HSP20 family molecular chaperone IbpA